jgi:hypothetical protein
MGMFDWYLPQPPIGCPMCDSALSEWQGKSGPRSSFEWVQGERGPRRQLVDDERALPPAERDAFRLPDEFELYTECAACKTWAGARGACEGGVWARTALTTGVDVALFEQFTADARGLFSSLEATDRVDFAELLGRVGSTLEYLLTDVFARHERTRAYWVDGVVLDEPTLRPDRSVLAFGYAWCAGHSAQWQVPMRAQFSLQDAPARGIRSLELCVGDAKLETLGAHRSQSMFGEPGAWLLGFDVKPGAIG